jgi:AraC family transcriptional regulator of arabinose operon
LVHEVAAYVHQNASGPISVSEVARAVGISESHLRARFRELVGVGVGAYIQRFRIHQARTLLHSSSLSMNGIAARCGYESIYSFSRAFRREMGMSASDYRRSLKAS